jgi:hypothetical protein
MATFNKNKLGLVFQAIAGPKTWYYTDTGLLIADVSEVAGFFTTGYDCGMRHGDRVLITEGDTGTWDTSGRQTGGRRQYIATVHEAVDTGATQVTLGLPVLVGDTS